MEMCSCRREITTHASRIESERNSLWHSRVEANDSVINCDNDIDNDNTIAIKKFFLRFQVHFGHSDATIGRPDGGWEQQF